MKKKLFSIVLSLCMVLALMPQMVFAETSGSTDDGFSYTISDAGEVTITGYTGSATEITIPGTIQSNPVKAIGDFAFSDCGGLTSINIPAGVTSIGNSAFDNCLSLTSIDIPSSVTSIGHHAFKYCASLTSINILAGDTSIGNSAFVGCVSLTSINIPAGVTSIGYEAFDECKGLESIFLSDGLDVSNARIRNEATKVRYSLNQTTGEVTITKIELGTDKESVDIPATICGYPVVAISDASLLGKISSHTCAGGAATCQTKAICGICKQEYGDNADHTLTKTDAKGATCTEDGNTEYWTCSVCNKYFSNETGTDEIEKDSWVIKAAHKMTKTEAQAATVIETGNKEYWHCKDCKKYFSDAAGTNEIKLDDTVISKLPPEIIEGMGQSIAEGEKKALTFRSNALFDDFDRVELDYETLNTEYYTAESGSIIVTLDADYVATLPVGEHTISIVSESGTATTTFTVAEKAAPGTSDNSDKNNSSDNDSKTDAEDSAKTGDDANLALWLALMFLSGAGITGTTLYTRRKRTSE